MEEKDYLGAENRWHEVQVQVSLDVAGVHSPTPDERAGMDWWNGLKEEDRRYWCLAAMTAVPSEAWRYYKLVTTPGRPKRVCQIE